MARKTFSVRPVEHAMATDNPSLYTPATLSPGILNCRFSQNSLKKRWGYVIDRSPLATVYEVVLYSKMSGTRHTLYLTGTDLISKDTAGTFTYRTQSYTTGATTGISGTPKSTVEGDGSVDWVAGGISSGDKFIMASDLAAHAEPNAHWATVESVTDLNTLVLTGVYGGAASVGAYVIRKPYTVPVNERWAWAIVDDKFCFGNGDGPVQCWDGSGYATDLNAALALKPRYMTEYANRVFLADVDVSGARSPITVRWSDEGLPATWTGTTSGELDLMDSADIIMGFGKAGQNLIIFKPDDLYVYRRSGIATNPITMVAYRPGVGNVAPYSPVRFLGTTAWVGRDDFYKMDGDQPVSIGAGIRTKFFSEVGSTEIKKVWGAVNHLTSEAKWFAETSSGQSEYVYNYKWNEWMVNQYATRVTAFGKGAV